MRFTKEQVQAAVQKAVAKAETPPPSREPFHLALAVVFGLVMACLAVDVLERTLRPGVVPILEWVMNKP